MKLLLCDKFEANTIRDCRLRTTELYETCNRNDDIKACFRRYKGERPQQKQWLRNGLAQYPSGYDSTKCTMDLISDLDCTLQTSQADCEILPDSLLSFERSNLSLTVALPLAYDLNPEQLLPPPMKYFSLLSPRTKPFHYLLHYHPTYPDI